MSFGSVLTSSPYITHFHETQVIKNPTQINACRYLRLINLLANFLLFITAVNPNYTIVANEAYK